MPKVPTAAPAREEELVLPEVPKKAPVVAKAPEEEDDSEIASAEVASKRKGLYPPQRCHLDLFSDYTICLTQLSGCFILHSFGGTSARLTLS